MNLFPFLVGGCVLLHGLTGVIWAADPSAAARTLPSTNSTRLFHLETIDPTTGLFLPSRIHLFGSGTNAIKAPMLPFWHDHFVSTGAVTLSLPFGKYRYEIERGPEFVRQRGTFDVDPSATNRLVVALPRMIDLAAEGWWSGDLHIHRPLEQIELLMRAEDLHMGPVITWWNRKNPWEDAKLPSLHISFDRNRFAYALAGEDEREGGALLFFQLSQPLAMKDATREYPSPLVFVEAARRQPGAWIDIEKPFWWDVPLWLASGQMDSIGLANNHMCRGGMLENEAWGKPRDPLRLPAPQGNGFWTQEIYYQALNCGLKLPPSAGSASGVLPNPVGYNRVYVHVDGPLSYEKWWASLRRGRSFVSNGPLLRCRANGEWPGYIFQGAPKGPLTIRLEALLETQDPVPFFEVIKNGQVEKRIAWADWKKTGDLGTITFDRSGWFLIRALADVKETFRFASTAPFYVEMGRPHISRASSRFFLDWTRERMGRIQMTDPGRRDEVLGYHRTAERFWEGKVRDATTE